MSRDIVLEKVASAALQQYPHESVVILEAMPTGELTDFIVRQDAVLAADALRRLRGDRASAIVEALPPADADRILGALEPAVAAGLVARMNEATRRQRLSDLSPQLAQELTEMMSYPANMAGAIMDPRVVNFRPSATVSEVLTLIRTITDRPVHNVFIVDDEGKLVGFVSVQELALSSGERRLEELMHGNPAAVQALSPQEELAGIAQDYRVSSVAVVDVVGRLIGVIRYPELLRATQRDATADIQTMVGVSKEERALSGFGFAVRKRLPWLTINLLTAFMAAAVVGFFESTIARFTALAVLLPVVAGQSGNAGAQALAVTMRALALREIRVRHWFRVARKELLAGTINGIAVASITSLGVFVWSQSVGVAMVIGVSMVISMVVAGLAGASVPMALIILRQDPAAASSIVLTTVTDIVGFMTFLGLATMASGML